MTLEENKSVAEEREMSHAASSPAAIMRTGSRVYRSIVTQPHPSAVRWGRWVGYVTANLRKSEEGNGELNDLVWSLFTEWVLCHQALFIFISKTRQGLLQTLNKMSAREGYLLLVAMNIFHEDLQICFLALRKQEVYCSHSLVLSHLAHMLPCLWMVWLSAIV